MTYIVSCPSLGRQLVPCLLWGQKGRVGWICLTRIQYKIAVITHKALSTSVPPYIDELLQRQVTTRSLRSTDAPRLSVPWTRTETAKRAFCVAAPNVWNSLPNDIRNASSLSSFRAKLKTHFLPARRYASTGNSDRNVSVRLSVRLSVCHAPVLCQNEES